MTSVADLPVAIGVRLVARGYLDAASEARARLRGHRDDEALHDFRVALRRLRSCIRAYRPWFDDTVKKKDRKALRTIARATGESRDLEVQIGWLRKQKRSKEVATAAKQLAAELSQRRRLADRTTMEAVRLFPEVCDRLRDRLTRYHAEIDPVDPLRAPTTAETAAGTATLYAANLATRLAAIQGVEDGTVAHEARIAGKRLRYILEPFESDTDNGSATIQLLKSLQDDLGDLHDLDVLLGLVATRIAALGVAESDEANEARPAWQALESHVRLERDGAFAAIQKTWLADRARQLRDHVASFTAQLRSHTAPAVEIERKFLLHRMPRRRAGSHSVRIDQGWLPGELLLERVRRVRGDDGTRYYRTIKTGAGLTRREIEEETSERVFRALWPLTRGRRVSKRRLIVDDGPFRWEIDRFYGRDLVLAEVELPSPETPVVPPRWLERYLDREVTGDPHYLNINLAS